MSKEYFTIAKVITPSDTLPNAFDAIYAGSTGNIVVMPDQGGAAVTFTAVQIGTVLPIKTRLVLATGTGAGPFVGLR